MKLETMITHQNNQSTEILELKKVPNGFLFAFIVYFSDSLIVNLIEWI